jgi:hypothetical protein
MTAPGRSSRRAVDNHMDHDPLFMERDEMLAHLRSEHPDYLTLDPHADRHSDHVCLLSRPRLDINRRCVQCLTGDVPTRQGAQEDTLLLWDLCTWDSPYPVG